MIVITAGDFLPGKFKEKYAIVDVNYDYNLEK